MAGYFQLDNSGNILFSYGYDDHDCRANSENKTATPQVRSTRLTLWWKRKKWNEWGRGDGHVVIELNVRPEKEQHGGSEKNLPTEAMLKIKLQVL